MILYLDAYFLTNFLMDLLLLDLTKHYLKLSGSSGRMVLAAGFGAAGACVLELVQVVGSHAWLRLGIGAVGIGLITGTAFGISDLRQWGLQTAVFGLSGMILAGGLELLLVNVPEGLPFGPALVIVVFFARWVWHMLIQRMRDEGRYCQVRLEYRGKTVEIRAIRDTGNLLYEPYHKKPVHVVTAEPIRKLCRSVDRVIYVPYRSVGEEQGIMPGIQIDCMTVLQKGRPALHLEKPWIAISPGPLTDGHQYDMLLHLDE